MFTQMKEWLQLKSLQSKIEAIAALVALMATGWSFILNTNPPADPRVVVVAKYEAEKSAFEFAGHNATAGQQALDDLAGKHDRRVMFDNSITDVTDADLKAKLVAYQALQDAFQTERNAVAEKYGLPACSVDDYDCNRWQVWARCAPRFTDPEPRFVGCAEELEHIANRYPFEAYRWSITKMIDTYAVIGDEWGTLAASVHNGRCKAYPDVCKAEADARRDEWDAMTAAQEFDAAYATAGDLGRLWLVAKGVAAKTWYWYLIFAFIFVAVLNIHGRYAIDPLTLETMVDGREVGVVIPFMAFTRPRLTGDVHVNWKVGVTWSGTSVLIDEDGVRIPLTGNVHMTQQVLPMLVHPSAHAYFASKNAEARALAVCRRAVMLTVEGLRRAPDAHRSETVRNVRANLIDMLRRELRHDDPVVKELEKRMEEERFSSKAS